MKTVFSELQTLSLPSNTSSFYHILLLGIYVKVLCSCRVEMKQCIFPPTFSDKQD